MRSCSGGSIAAQRAGRNPIPSGACIDADHFLLIYALWLGTMPALLKGFLQQVFRPGVAPSYGEGFQALMKGKSARIAATMGMPTLA